MCVCAQVVVHAWECGERRVPDRRHGTDKAEVRASVLFCEPMFFFGDGVHVGVRDSQSSSAIVTLCPAVFVRFTRRNLDMASCSISGTLPAGITDLSNLEYVWSALSEAGSPIVMFDVALAAHLGCSWALNSCYHWHKVGACLYGL